MADPLTINVYDISSTTKLAVPASKFPDVSTCFIANELFAVLAPKRCLLLTVDGDRNRVDMDAGFSVISSSNAARDLPVASSGMATGLCARMLEIVP